MREQLKDCELMVCSCERTMTLDGEKLARALDLPETPHIYNHLCRAQIDLFEKACASGKPMLVCCTQEAPLFHEVAEEIGAKKVSFANIRERAGWSNSGESAHPKIAALIAEATVAPTRTRLKTITSEGTCLVYGRGQTAFDAAAKLSTRLDVSLMLIEADGVIPPGSIDVPIHTGKITSVNGALGRFEVSFDGYASMVPSSKDELVFAMPRNGVTSECDIILDLSGDPPLVSSHERRDGYLRADPNHPASIAEALFEAADLIGEFDKPLYVSYDASICAHGRSGKIGCTNCLDNCPLSAITPNGDHIVVDDAICGGCGNCSASCPTGAVTYDYPSPSNLIERAQTVLSTYLNAGGADPILLLHDEDHGSQLISLMARFGKGLPANVLPLSVYSPLMIGHDILSAAITAGAHNIAIILPPNKTAELASLENQTALTKAFLDGLGFNEVGIHIIHAQDPDAVEEQLYALAPITPPLAPTVLGFVGSKREIARTALLHLNESASEQQNILALPEGAPYGRIEVNTDGCTLCLACVASCPAGALSDTPDRPEIRFTEAACVQCGLCKATCPEKVISLAPQFNFTDDALRPATLNGEDPFNCISCGKEFGTKSTIERIIKELEGKHWMYADTSQSDLIKMCDDCRVIASMERQDQGKDPYAMGEVPRVRTTEDYQRADKKARESGGDPEDFLN